MGTLANGMLTGGAKNAFPAGYTSAGTWVSAPGGTFVLHLDFGIPKAGVRGPVFDVPIHRAIVTFDHTSPLRATNGTIAGVISTEELIAGLAKMPGRIYRSLCDYRSFDAVAEQIRQAADILIDGTNTPGVPCDAISIGVGFEADEVTNVSRVLPDPPLGPDPCAVDAGAPVADASSE